MWERRETQQQEGGDRDWAQDKGKSIGGIMFSRCGQKATLAWQYCCPGLEEDVIFLDLIAAELPSNLKSHGGERFLFAMVIHRENDNNFTDFITPGGR